MSDEELLYLFVVIKNDWAFRTLYQRYQNIISIITKKIFAKFFALPLELIDLQSITYFIFYESIFNFQNNKNKNFKNFLLISLKWELLRYLKKYLHKNHQILNLALSYQDYFYQQQFVTDGTNLNYFKLFACHNLKLSFCEKNVLKLKCQGYSNYEVMNKLNLTYKQVDNAFQRVILKFKKMEQ